MKTAVAFIVFNRPEVTRRVLARIRDARPPTLFVIADGPRAGKPGEVERCAEVRAIIDELTDWPCEVRRNYSEVNLGCGRRVSSGLDWVFEHVEEAIILEDDCLPDTSFFPFCEELLARYRYDERVAQIAGCSFLPANESSGGSYFFSRYPHCWGWATWRRAWANYDDAMTVWRTKAESSWVNGPERERERYAWKRAFDGVVRGTVDSWAYRWTAALWGRGGLSANSRVNLISNLGFSDEATHTRTGRWGGLPTCSAILPPCGPVEVARDERLDALVGRLVFEAPPLWERVMNRLRRSFNV